MRYLRINRAGRLIVIENFDIKEPKTKDLVKLLGPYLNEQQYVTVFSFSYVLLPKTPKPRKIRKFHKFIEELNRLMNVYFL